MGKDFQQPLLGGRRRCAPSAAFVTLPMQAFVQECAQLRLAGTPECIAEVGQRRVEFAHNSLRCPHQLAVGDNTAGQPLRGAQGPDVVNLPQRQPHPGRHAVPGTQRARHLHRVAVDMDAHRRFEQWPPEWKQEAKPRLLDEPRPMRVHVEHDVRHRPAVHRVLIVHGRCIETADAIPVAPHATQHGVVEPPNILPLPKALGILLVGARALMLRPEIAPHEVEHPRNRRSAGTVHS